jgi:hypothetical protein
MLANEKSRGVTVADVINLVTGTAAGSYDDQAKVPTMAMTKLYISSSTRRRKSKVRVLSVPWCVFLADFSFSFLIKIKHRNT